MKKTKIFSLVSTLLLSMSMIGATAYAQTTTNNTLSVQSYGATGNDQTDDTAKIQSAIDYASSKGLTVDIPAGTYYINPNTGLFLRDNTTLKFENGAKLVSLATSNGFYNILKIWGVSNVKVTGYPTIVGDRNIHTGTSGEWGMGIGIESSNNVYIENANISNCWGDGIYVGVINSQSQQYSKDITINNAVLNNNRRQGISVISAINLTINSPTITNTNGTSPESGIDFEPNSASEYAQKILVTNPKVQNNKGNGIQFFFGNASLTNPISITIDNVSNVINNGQQNVRLYNNGMTTMKGFISVGGKTIFGTEPTQTQTTSSPTAPTSSSSATQPVTSTVNPLQQQVDTLKAENTNLTSENTALKAQVQKLTDENNALKTANDKESTKIVDIQNILNQ